ncbi:MAG TPA: UbiA family prenyltransferase [Gemmatimonadales bacterium]|nr:UbiA family prenyltransferase [Gemmatimonadales bacterium]
MSETPVGSGRRVGYRLLGRGFDYLLHLRPAEWPIVAAHTAVGAILAVGFRGVVSPELWPTLIVAIGAWVVGLNGGTLAINSAFDRDEGDVAYLRRPPPPPPGLFLFGLCCMVFGLGLTWQLPGPYRTVYLVCFAMSILYSVPPWRLKAVAGADWLINMVGFGLLTPLAGWAATGAPVTPTGRLLLVGFLPLFAALYPLTQLYQMEEDTRRGDQTLAIRLGIAKSLRVALVATVLAFGCFGGAALQSGWTFAGADMLRWSGLAIAATAWALVLVPWTARAARMTPAEHQRGMHLALAAWAVTDLAIVLAWG